MTVKEDVLNIINKLPSEVEMDEIMQALYIQSKFSRGEQEINQGKSVPHEKAVEIMKSWQK